MSDATSQIRAIPGQLHCHNGLLYKSVLKTIRMLPLGRCRHAWLMGRTGLGRKVVGRVEFPESIVDSLALMPG